jgi:hypothetical protein
VLLASIVAVLSIVASSPASAGTYDLIPANDGGSCNAVASINIQAIAPDVYTLRVTGSANCPGAGQTTILVCMEMQQLNGDYEANPGGTCGTGSSSQRPMASTEVVCTPGSRFRGTVVASQGTTIGKAKTGPVTCPNA